MNTRPLCLWLSCSLLLLSTGAARPADEPLAPEVPVSKPLARQVADHEDFTGRTEAASTVEVRARVTGHLDRVLFKDGAEVRQGDLLFEIDSRLYRAGLVQAEAGLAVSEARLRRVDADVKRMKALAERGAVGREEFDKLLGDRVEAEAGVAVAKAALEIARLSLDYATVKAPVAGRVGRRVIDAGNLVRADDTLLATIVSEKPGHVTFEADERTLLRLWRAAREGGKVKGLTDPGLPVAVGLADEAGFPHQGRLDFVDNRVAPDRGTVRMRATVPNEAGLLVPGLSARVRMVLGEPYKALLVPEEAVLRKEGQASVLVVGEKSVLESKKVLLGPRVGGLRAVREGRREGDSVVGKVKGLRAGMAIRPRESALTDAANDPGAADSKKRP